MSQQRACYHLLIPWPNTQEECLSWSRKRERLGAPLCSGSVVLDDTCRSTTILPATCPPKHPCCPWMYFLFCYVSFLHYCDCVIGRLYSIQYKNIFGVPNKVRLYTCDEARLLSQVWGVEPNTSSGYEVAEPPHHHHTIAGMQHCIPTLVFGTGQTKHVKTNGNLHGPLFRDWARLLSF